MEKIRSFMIDHTKLNAGVYLSKVQEVGGGVVTTYDLRMRRPNIDPVMGTGEMHAIEHIGATYLRTESDLKDQIIYFGPMGCRTGYYLLLSGKMSLEDVLKLVREMFEHIADFSGDIPGASPVECGNYSDMNLQEALKSAATYLKDTLNKISVDDMNYQE